MKLLKKAICVSAVLAMGSFSASAADLSDNNYSGSLKDSGQGYWIVNIGGYGVAEPRFEGSKHYEGSFQPYFQVYRAGEKPDLSLPNDSFGVTLFRNGAFRAGIAADYEEGRFKADLKPDLLGLHKVDLTAQFGGFAEYWVTNAIRTRVEILQGVSGDDGLLVNLMADYVFSAAAKWQFTFGPRLQFTDGQYEKANFGVTASDALATGLQAYRAGGGLHSAGLEATAKYDISDRWQVRGFVEYKKLLGDAGDSPIVTQRGSEDQVRVGLGASYALTLPSNAIPLK